MHMVENYSNHKESQDLFLGKIVADRQLLNIFAASDFMEVRLYNLSKKGEETFFNERNTWQ